MSYLIKFCSAYIFVLGISNDLTSAECILQKIDDSSLQMTTSISSVNMWNTSSQTQTCLHRLESCVWFVHRALQLRLQLLDMHELAFCSILSTSLYVGLQCTTIEQRIMTIIRDQHKYSRYSPWVPNTKHVSLCDLYAPTSKLCCN